MKILHTSDLHIGKRLYQEELAEEQQFFFNWLVEQVKDKEIDALLVSGDVFDVANPSSESRKSYYDLLVQLSRLQCKVIITAGNHDSPAVLEAPKELLKELDIHVIAGLPEDPGKTLIPLGDAGGKPQLVVAAIPFLRDSDLRKRVEDESSEDRVEAVRSGIIRVYARAAETCQNLYPGVPAIAMGHLYVQGGSISESEREIQVGNLAGVQEDRLPGYFCRYALGHLHKPQETGRDESVIYCGSPVKLSFSERNNDNRVVCYTLHNGIVSSESVSVPEWRKLVKLSGKVSELKSKLDNLQPGNNMLKMFIELDAVEENHDPAKVLELEAMAGEFRNDSAQVLKYRITFSNKPAGTASLYDINVNIEDLKPADVFKRKLENENVDEETSQLLNEAFNELLEEVRQKEEEK